MGLGGNLLRSLGTQATNDLSETTLSVSSYKWHGGFNGLAILRAVTLSPGSLRPSTAGRGGGTSLGCTGGVFLSALLYG